VLASGGGEFAHGYTYSGHPVACAVALANLDVIEATACWAASGRHRGPTSAGLAELAAATPSSARPARSA
jgi:putrescine---pyruvate transaminase